MGRKEDLQIYLNKIQSGIAEVFDYINAIEVFAELQNYNKILSNCEDGIKKFPEANIFHYWIAYSHHNLDNKEQAFNSINIALSKNPNHKESVLLACDIARSSNEQDVFIEFLKLALENFSSDKDILDRVYDFFSNNTEFIPANVNMLITAHENGERRLGKYLLNIFYENKDETNRAIDIYIENFNLAADDEDFCKFVAANIIKNIRKEQKAVDVLYKIHKSGLKNPDVIGSLADSFSEKKYWEEEYQIIYEHAVELNVATYPVFRLLAQKYMLLRLNDEKSIDVIFQYFLKEPDNKDTISYLLPEVLKKSKYNDEEKNFLKIAFKLFPNNFEIFKKLVDNLLFTQEDVIENLSMISKYLELNPNSENAIKLLGNAYLSLGRRDSEALYVYEKFVRYAPDNLDLINILTEYYLSENRKSRLSIIIYEKAVSLGIKNMALFRILSDYYLEKGIVTEISIQVFSSVHNEIKNQERVYQKLIELVKKAILSKSIEIRTNEFYFEVLRDILKKEGDPNLEKTFLSIAFKLEIIDNESFELYKALYSKYSKTPLTKLLFKCYLSRNIIDATGRTIFESLYDTLELEDKNRATLLLSQYFIDNKIKNEFSSAIISESNTLISTGIKLEGNLEKTVQHYVKTGKTDFEALDQYYHYLQINKNNPSVYRELCKILISTKNYDNKYLQVVKRTLQMFPDWVELLNYYALTLAENKIRDEESFAIWEKYLINGGTTDIIIFELMSKYINDQIINERSERTFKLALEKGYKNQNILLPYARCLAKSGNFPYLIKILKEVIEFDITETSDIKFIADNLLLYAQFDLLEKFLANYSEKSMIILDYKIKNLFYSNKLGPENEVFLDAFIKHTKFKESDKVVFELYGDYFFYEKNNPEKAMMGYEYFLKIQPTDVLVLYKSAICSLEIGDLLTALKSIKKLLLFKENDIEAQKIAANIYIELENYEEAASLFKKIINLGYNDVEIFKNYAKALYKTQQYYSAIDIYKEILQDDPNNEDVLLNLAYAFASIEFKEESIKTLEKIIELNQRNKEALNSLFSIYLEDDRRDEKGERLYNLVLHQGPDNLDALKMLSFIYADLGRNDKKAINIYKSTYYYRETTPEIIKILSDKIIEDNEFFDREFSIEILKRSVDYFPSNTKFWSNLIDFIYYEEDIEANIDFYERSLSKSIRSLECTEKLAVIYFNQGDHEKSVFYAKSVLALNPYKSDIYTLIGRILILKNDHEGAKENLENAIVYDSLNFTAYYYYSQVMYHLQNIPIALNNLEKALKINSYYLEAIFLFAKISNEKKMNLEKAKEFLKFIIDIYQKNWEVPYWLSIIYNDLKEKEMALINIKIAYDMEKNEQTILAYSDILEGDVQSKIDFLNEHKKDLESPVIYNKLGQFYNEIGNHEDAKEAFAGAKGLNPYFVDTLIELGKLNFYYTNDIDIAFVEFKNILESEPDNRVAKCFLGKIMFKKKEYDKALKFYEGLGSILDYEDYKNLITIYYERQDYEEVLQLIPILKKNNVEDQDVNVILFKTYYTLNIYDEAIKLFEIIKFKDNELAKKYFEDYFRILIDSVNFPRLRQELLTLIKDPRNVKNYAKIYFFLEYLIYQTDFSELQFILNDVLTEKNEDIVDFKKNTDLMLMQILLFEDKMDQIEGYIHLFNKKDPTIKFLTGIYQFKNNKQESSMYILKEFEGYFSHPYFTDILNFFKDALIYLNDSFRFTKIWKILACSQNAKDIDFWMNLFFKYAENKFESEVFLKKDKYGLAFKNLLSRIERYEIAKGGKDSDLNSDILLNVYQFYNFIKNNFAEAEKIAKKYKRPGLLFSKELYSNLNKKKIDKKSILKIINSTILLEDIPYFYDYLEKNKMLEILKDKIIGNPVEKLTQTHIKVLFDLYERDIVEDGEEFMKILEGSNSYLLRYLLDNENIDAANELVKNMDYIEFISPENSYYILETLRKQENYDQLLTFRSRMIDKRFVNDSIKLYYAIALHKMSFTEDAKVILSDIKFQEVKYLNALNSLKDADLGGISINDAIIEKFLNEKESGDSKVEMMDFLMQNDKEYFRKFENLLRDKLSEENFNILKGRIDFIEGKFDEARPFLEKSSYIDDLILLLPLSQGNEALGIAERVINTIKDKREYYERFETFLPFSYKGIYLYNAKKEIIKLNFQLYEIYSNLRNLEGKLKVGEEIVKYDPTQLHLYQDIYYIYKDFKKDISNSIRISERILGIEPKNVAMIIEKAKLLLLQKKFDYALNFLLDSEVKDRKIYEFTANIYKEKKLFMDAINIYDQLIEQTKDIKYFEEILDLKDSMGLDEDIITLVDENEFTSSLITYYQGKAFYSLKKYEDALKKFTVISIPDFKYKDELNITLGLTYFNLKNFEKSKNYFQRSVKLSIKSEIAFFKLAEMLYKEKKYDRALQTLDMAFTKYKDQSNIDPTMYLLSAELYLELGKKADLVKALRTLQKLTLPDTLENHLRYGIILFKASKFEKAEIEFLRVLQMQYDHAEVLKYLIEIYIKNESYMKALPLVERAYKKDPKNNAYVLARVLYSLNKYEEARNIIKDVKESTEEIEFFKGKVYYALRSFQEAHARFQIFYQKNPRNFEANLYLGRINLERYNFIDALEYLKSAENLNENNFEVMKYLGFTYNKLGDTINTIIFLKKALSLNSEDYETILVLAELYFHKKRFKEAIKDFKRVITIKYNIANVHFMLAKAYRNLNDLDNAEISIDNAISLENESIFVIEKIKILEIANKIPEILKTIQDYEKDNELDSEITLIQIKNLRLANRYNLAMEVIEKYKEKNDEKDSHWEKIEMEKAFLLYHMKKYDDALFLLEKLYPKTQDDDIFITLCFSLLELNKISKLKALIRQYKGILLKSEYIPYIMGYIELIDGNKEIALNYFYQAITINKAFLPAYRKLIEVYLKNKNYIMTIDLLNTSLKYEKYKKMDIYYYLGISYLETGETFKALKSIKEALKWDYQDSAEKLSDIYKIIGLFSYGVISTKKLWLEKRINSAYAWEQIIYFLFKIGRKLDATIESFFNLKNIKNQELILEFAESLYEYYQKPHAAYLIINSILDIKKKDERMLSIFLKSVSTIDVDHINEVKQIERLSIELQNPYLFEALGIYYYNKNEMSQSSQYFQKAININPDLEKTIYYLSLLK